MVLPVTSHAFQVCRTQRCELGSMRGNTEELWLHTHLMLERHRWNHDASCDVSFIRSRRNLRCCAWSMQNSGTGGTDSGLGLFRVQGAHGQHSCKGTGNYHEELERCDTSTAQSTTEHPNRESSWTTLSGDVETRAGRNSSSAEDVGTAHAIRMTQKYGTS